jgi:hypothetical protein
MERVGAFEEVNDAIRSLATEGPATEVWEFFCECPDLACHVLVSLTLAEFDEQRAMTAPVVAGHHLAA